MTLPLDERPDETEELTTADLARSANRPDQPHEVTEFQGRRSRTYRARMPVRSERSVTDISERTGEGSSTR